jgi:hypothetical protein
MKHERGQSLLTSPTICGQMMQVAQTDQKSSRIDQNGILKIPRRSFCTPDLLSQPMYRDRKEFSKNLFRPYTPW